MHRAPRRRSRHRRGLWTAAALAATALLAVLLVRPWSTAQSPASGGSDADPGRNPAAAAAVRWTATELDPDTPVTVPDELRDVVVAAGGDRDRFAMPETSSADGLRMVAGEPPRGALVLARFPGPQGDLTIVDPSPGRPTPEELERRQRLSRALLANPSTGATGRAADVLRSGHLDARLLGLTAALVTQLETRIADLPPAPGEPEGQQPPDEPLVRSVLVDRVGDRPVPADEAATDRLTAFLDAQLPPYAPQTVEVTDAGVRVGFRYDSAPDALVTASTP